MTSGSQGVANARVTLTGPSGTRTVITGTFGNYRFDNVTPGVSYTIAAKSNRFNFTSQTLQINNNATDINLIAQE